MQRGKFNPVHFLVMRVDFWVASWMDMLCGLISVATLTTYRPWWDMEYRCWSAKLVMRVLKHNKFKDA